MTGESAHLQNFAFNMSKCAGARPRLHNTCGTSHTDKHTPGCKDSSRGLAGVVLHTEQNKGSCWIDSASPTLIRKKDVPELVDIETATWPVYRPCRLSRSLRTATISLREVCV